MIKTIIGALFLWLLIYPNLQAQQVIINDDFSDGDFTQSPSWLDTESKHIVNGNNQLQLDAPALRDTAVITTASTAAFGEWNFWVKFDFNPSSTSFTRLYLVSNTQEMKGPVNGYYVRVGHTDDEVSLFRQDGKTSTKIIDGTDDLINAGEIIVRVGVTRNLDGNWQLSVDPEGGQNFISQGTVFDNTYTESRHIGIFSKYIGSRSDLYFYDDIMVEKLTPPLNISQITPVDNQTINVRFNLSLDSTTVNTGDFRVNNGAGNPDQIRIMDDQTVQLLFPTTLPGGSYRLNISNVNDQEGNTIPPNTSASFRLFDPFNNGDIVINEFMYDPPGNLTEYVELRNTTHKIFNLQDWQLGDHNSTNLISNDTLVLEPDSFLVISPDVASLMSLFGDRNYHEMSTMPALNNSGDELKVFTDDGRTADSLTYSPAWGGSEVALERRETEAPSTVPENWEESPATEGGTPGLENLAEPDTKAPELSGLQFPDASTLIMAFSERLDPNSAQNSSNYGLSGSSQVETVLQVAPDTVMLSIAPPMENNTDITLSTDNLTDIFGNVMAQTDTTFRFFEIEEADSGEVLVNEFMFDPPEGFTEYVELVNVSDKTINLQNWQFNDAAGTPASVVSSKLTLTPGEFVVLAPDHSLQQLFPDISLISMGNSFSSLNNSSDRIIILNAEGVVMDSLKYDDSWGGSEIALERRNTEVSGIFRENWGDSPASAGGTPGGMNQIPPDTTAPFITSFGVVNERTLQLVFSETTVDADKEMNYQLSPSVPIRDAAVMADTVRIGLETALVSGITYSLSIDTIQDLFGNTPSAPLEETFTFFETAEPEAGDLIINEFMYKPPDGLTEYIEILNRSTQAADLSGLMLNDNSGPPMKIAGNRTILPPGERIALVPDRSLLSVFPEIRFLNIGAAFQTLNNGGDAIVLSKTNGLRIDSLTFLPSWGGDGLALERRTENVSAIFRENWGDSPVPEGGTPGLENRIEPDTTAPELTGLQLPNRSMLMLSFSERLSQSSLDIDNFTLSAPSQVITAKQIAPDTITLSLAPPVEVNTDISLSFNGLKDIFGNVMSRTDTTFQFLKTEEADSGEVLVNEFMFDPPEGFTEYVELVNVSDKTINLQNWQFNDAAGTPASVVSSKLTLTPGEFVVLAPDHSLQQLFPDISLISMGNSFSSLNNSSDRIIILNAEGVVMDSLEYDDSWGGSEIALERRNTEVSGIFRENWGDSPASAGGTPGLSNQVANDEIAPKLLSVEATAPRRIQISLSERPATPLTNTPAVFQLQPFRTIQRVSVEGTLVELFLAQPLVTDQLFTLQISNLEDLFGNQMPQTQSTFEMFDFEPARTRDVVINEILFQKAANSDAEFVELFNRSDRDINLNGWTIGDSGDNPATLRPNDTESSIPLPAGEFIVLANTPPLVDTLSRILTVPGFPSLNDDEDAVVIRNRRDQVIDSLFYSSSWGGDENGVSLERIDPFGASNDQSNWGTSRSDFGSTPGRKNSGLQVDGLSPKPVFATLRPDGNFEITFSEFVERTEALTFRLNQSRLEVVHFSRTDADRVILKGIPVDSISNIQITIRNLQDFRGNKTKTSTIPLSLPLKPGDVVFNEIMFDPLTREEDNTASQSEYLELFNRSSHAVSLEGMMIFEERTSGKIPEDKLELVSNRDIFIPSGGYYLIFSDPAESFFETRISRFFALDSLSFFSRVDANSLQLANSGQPLVLTDSTGTTIDSVAYREEWHNPNLIDTRGISLERKVPGSSSNDAENWGSASTRAVPEGGTPGKPNTLLTTPGNLAEENSITLEPNPFSPNGDGKDDNLVINYSLSETDFLLRVRIYDRYGRKVRTLADGEPAGRTGTVIWDGRNDEGQKNRIGYYIIYFEAFDSASGNNKTFKKTVVLARQL